ncbi:hypothetical protein [Amycolatopsis sp. CA-230715]|uniref:hypothetical protein n=1 Tax=Amycolatopsis sp. CA-230715 TaxID=2745196 RepID=UPI001C00AF81|nr:hypothetical protein [Amycolatopsis sp. CA-230715]QWF85894.1 hypothetical protein HUW46_09374 [Amycolatopsis sp. CA-230715]
MGKANIGMSHLVDTVLTRVRAVHDLFVRVGRYELLLPADDGTVEPLIAFFRGRDWEILDRESDTVASFYYPASFGDAFGNLNRGYLTVDVGLNELECDLYRHGGHWIARFTTCGAIIGCARHRSTPLIVGLHTGAFPGVLDRLERQARALHPDKISRCLFSGSCGSNDNPREPCRTGVRGHDTLTLHAVSDRDDAVT